MKKLTEACSSFGFTNVWTQDGKIICQEDNRIKVFLTNCVQRSHLKVSFKIAAPSCFDIQREKTHNFSLVLDIVFREICYSYFFVNMQANKPSLYWKDVGNKLYFKDFVSTLLNLLKLPVYLRRTLLNGCLQDVANTQDKNAVWKFVQRKL